jgi:hypothetical protein
MTCENIEKNPYQIQDSALLFDIRNFSESKHVIFTHYYEKNFHLLQYEKDADKYWLLSDIILFIKINRPEIYKNINKKFIRNLQISKCDINIFWSILTPLERNTFVEIRTRNKDIK